MPLFAPSVESDRNLGAQHAKGMAEATSGGQGSSDSRRTLAVILDSENIFEEHMLYKLGRILQFVGLFLFLPLAMAGQAADALTLGQMFVWVGVGIAIFYAGWMLQQSHKP